MTDTPEISDFETAFIIVRDNNGEFFATTELGEAFTINRTANKADIKRACRDLYDKIVLDDIAEIIVTATKPVDEVRESMKRALSERNLL